MSEYSFTNLLCMHLRFYSAVYALSHQAGHEESSPRYTSLLWVIRLLKSLLIIKKVKKALKLITD